MPPKQRSPVEYGCIEVVVDQDQEGDPCDKVYCYEPQTYENATIHFDDQTSIQSIQSEQQQEEEGVEVDELEFTSLLWEHFFTCTGCAPKPILKKPGRVPGKPLDRAVSFSSLEIKEFDMTLGDHPNAASGPPVRLENRHKSERTVSLEEYEQTRSPRRKRRQMRLSYQDRKDILTKQHSVDEVNQAWAEARRIRLQREETLRRGLLLMTWDDLCESADRKYRRTLQTIGL